MSSSGFYLYGGPQSENEKSEKINKYVDLARELKKLWKLLGDADTNCSWCSWNGLQRIEKGTGGVENQRKNRDYPDHSIVKIGQNAEKCPGDMRKLAVT